MGAGDPNSGPHPYMANTYFNMFPVPVAHSSECEADTRFNELLLCKLINATESIIGLCSSVLGRIETA